MPPSVCGESNARQPVLDLLPGSTRRARRRPAAAPDGTVAGQPCGIAPALAPAQFAARSTPCPAPEPPAMPGLAQPALAAGEMQDHRLALEHSSQRRPPVCWRSRSPANPAGRPACRCRPRPPHRAARRPARHAGAASPAHCSSRSSLTTPASALATDAGKRAAAPEPQAVDRRQPAGAPLGIERMLVQQHLDVVEQHPPAPPFRALRQMLRQVFAQRLFRRGEGRQRAAGRQSQVPAVRARTAPAACRRRRTPAAAAAASARASSMLRCQLAAGQQARAVHLRLHPARDRR